MNLIDNIAYSEAMLGYHDATFEVGAYARGASGDGKAGGEEGFFSTLLDIINPLQHIPLVSSLYREITGDEISPTASIIGGGLFGGPIGLASASANAIFEQASGDDIIGHAVAMFSDGLSGDSQQAGTPAIHQQADAGGHAVASTAPANSPPAYTEPDIVLGGPPALAGLKAAPVAPATPATASAAPVSLAPPAIPGKPVTPAPRQAEPAAPTRNAETDAFVRSLPANWVSEALRDAQTINQAQQSGSAPESGTAKPWVGNAMLDALAKYEALTKARAEAGTVTNNGSGNRAVPNSPS